MENTQLPLDLSSIEIKEEDPMDEKTPPNGIECVKQGENAPRKRIRNLNPDLFCNGCDKKISMSRSTFDTDEDYCWNCYNNQKQVNELRSIVKSLNATVAQLEYNQDLLLQQVKELMKDREKIFEEVNQLIKTNKKLIEQNDSIRQLVQILQDQNDMLQKYSKIDII